MCISVFLQSLALVYELLVDYRYVKHVVDPFIIVGINLFITRLLLFTTQTTLNVYMRYLYTLTNECVSIEVTLIPKIYLTLLELVFFIILPIGPNYNEARDWLPQYCCQGYVYYCL
ncbi:hypothetical protein ACJX0J_031136, partial [Zea mays]